MFVRVVPNSGESFVVVMPEKGEERSLREARSTHLIGRHLLAQGVPVPHILAADESSGFIAFEDLGDIHLQNRVRRASSSGEIRSYYQEALDILVHFQIAGRHGFDQGWCWDTPAYDRELMLTRESRYFLEEFWHGFLRKKNHPEQIWREFERLADLAAAQESVFLLHRDFQSRNLMVCNDKLRVIDFQSARLGPLGYDLASLLIDPYVGLSEEDQLFLFDYYLERLARKREHINGKTLAGYYFLALQRNLQILGAFAFLTQKKGKVFFLEFIEPAALSLARLLAKPELFPFPLLRSMAEDALQLLAERQASPPNLMMS